VPAMAERELTWRRKPGVHGTGASSGGHEVVMR
jgi:hypothetical protein